MNAILEKLADAISDVEKALEERNIGQAMRANDRAKTLIRRAIEEQEDSEEIEEIEIIK